MHSLHHVKGYVPIFVWMCLYTGVLEIAFFGAGCDNTESAGWRLGCERETYATKREC